MDHRRRRARHRPCIHHQHDRRIQKFRDVRRGGHFPTAALAVEKAHDALDHGYLRAARAVGEEWTDEIRAGEKSIQITPWPSGGESMIRRVYEVRADLERRDLVALRGERGHQAGSHGGLPDAGVRPRNNYARYFYHSIPFCPR